ncbi:MAG: KH domain-containing protein [Thermofilaceae archaeon]
MRVRLMPFDYIVLPSDSLRLVERKVIAYLDACEKMKERGDAGLNRVEEELAKAKPREYDAVLRGLMVQAYRYALSGRDVRAFIIFNDKNTKIQYDKDTKTVIIALPQEYKNDMGLLIGKEGRNIRVAQQLLGVRIQFVLQS